MSKRNLIIYWIATALLSFGMLGSGISQLIRHPDIIAITDHLGYPIYLASILGTWKVLGVIALLLPGYKLLKEWAYAGFFFAMTGAFVSHLFMGDPVSDMLGPIFQTIFIILSWYFRPDSRKFAI